MNIYEDALIQDSKNLDHELGNEPIFYSFVCEIIKNKSDNSSVLLCKELTRITFNSSENIKSLSRKLRDSLFMYYGYEKVNDQFKLTTQTANDELDKKTLEELLSELNLLTGLDAVKKQVNDLIAYHKIRKLRESYGLFSEKNTLHMAFIGNPGTGKTTVARIVGRIYKKIGLLTKGHFTEVSRTDLIAGYQGQTALKVKKVIENAKGGVLFIDEAYSITENENSDSYGRECLTELTKALEDFREDLVVIVAGYKEPMKTFFSSNPGLKSRFNCFIDFEDYNINELISIFEGLCYKNNYELADNAITEIRSIINSTLSTSKNQFSNGRYIRNLFNKIVLNQAIRLSSQESIDEMSLKTITCDDIHNTSSYNEEVLL